MLHNYFVKSMHVPVFLHKNYKSVKEGVLNNNLLLRRVAKSLNVENKRALKAT